MNIDRLVASFIIGFVALVQCESAMPAAVTTASASAFISGITVTDGPNSTAGTGAIATASQTASSLFGDGFATGQAVSRPGVLGASAVGRSTGAAGGFKGAASASWTDNMLFGGLLPGTSGIFDPVVVISGGLFAEFTGRTFSIADVAASLSVGGQSVSGFSELLVSALGERRTGDEGLALTLSGVPFRVGVPLVVSLSLAVSGSADVTDAGATGRGMSDYAHTLTWGGLGDVRDANGVLLTDFTAVSPDSGFDFRGAAPASVAEPDTGLLLTWGALVGLLARAATLQAQAGQFRWRAGLKVA